MRCGGDSTAKKIAFTVSSIRRIILPLAPTHGQAAVLPTPSDSLLDADAPGDDSVFGTDANRHEDISHNGTSRFSGNAYSAEVADAAAGLRAPLRSLGGLLIKAQIAASANFWAINDGCSNSLRII